MFLLLHNDNDYL
jgi:protein SPT2